MSNMAPSLGDIEVAARWLKAAWNRLLGRPPERKEERPPAKEFYDVVDVTRLYQSIARAGGVEPAHVERQEMAEFQPQDCQFLLISGPPEVGKTFEAYHAVRTIISERGPSDLKLLHFPNILAVPNGLPPGGSKGIVIFIDNLHEFATRRRDLGSDICETIRSFQGWLRGATFCLVATTLERDADALLNSMRQVPVRITHIRLIPLSTDKQREYFEALRTAFDLDVSAEIMDALLAANDGTVVAAYDIFAEAHNSGRTELTEEDVERLQERVQSSWHANVGQTLPQEQRRVLEVLSIMRFCGVPLQPWIVERLAYQQDWEANQLRLLVWKFSKRRKIRAAMRALEHPWIPLSEAGEFTPHDSRLQLERENIIEDASFVARALVGVCDHRPVRAGLRDAYAGLESIFYTQERYDLLLPLLQAWIRTSVRPGKDDPPLSDLIAQFQGDAQPPPPDSAKRPALVGTVANRYRDLPTGSRADNLQKAMACYEAVLRVYTEDEFRVQWATTQNNLGLAYWDLPTGDRAKNLQDSIECYQAALRVHTEDAFPEDWAMTQNNLGLAYADLPTGDRGQNLQQAIACYRAALHVYTEDAFPEDWAMTQNNLGIAYCEVPTGDRGENLEQGIACYEAALRVYTQYAFPQDWAMTQNNLGGAYFHLPTGDRGKNLQQAIACYEAALRVRTEDAFPVQWATTMYNLGLLYLDPDLPGEPPQNRSHAIESFEAALRVLTEEGFPEYHARASAALERARAMDDDS